MASGSRGEWRMNARATSQHVCGSACQCLAWCEPSIAEGGTCPMFKWCLLGCAGLEQHGAGHAVEGSDIRRCAVFHNSRLSSFSAGMRSHLQIRCICYGVWCPPMANRSIHAASGQQSDLFVRPRCSLDGGFGLEGLIPRGYLPAASLGRNYLPINNSSWLFPPPRPVPEHCVSSYRECCSCICPCI